MTSQQPDEPAGGPSRPGSVAGFLGASRVLIVAGKGGVGKSTVAAALARVAHGAGLSVALVATDDKARPAGVPEGVSRILVDPGGALNEYLSDHGLARVSRQLVNSGITDLVASTAPGIDDLLVLGKIKQMERAGTHDVIIVDGPAAGQALDMLRAPAVLRRAVTAGPVRSQADDVLAMLADSARCRVMLVTAPEATPIQEMVDTAFELEEDIGVCLSPVVVNGIDRAPREVTSLDADALASLVSEPAVAAAARHRLARVAAHREAVAELEASFPLRHLDVPRVTPTAGADHLVSSCAEALVAAITALGDPR